MDYRLKIYREGLSSENIISVMINRFQLKMSRNDLCKIIFTHLIEYTG